MKLNNCKNDVKFVKVIFFRTLPISVRRSIFSARLSEEIFAVLSIGSIGWHHQSRMYVREQAHEKEEHHELEVSAEDDVEEAYTEGEAHTEAEEEEA